jgi:glycosyltransferase involved in cell wall biosynthesis
MGTRLNQASLLQRREYEAWKYADLIFCASSFTKRSLLEVGADAKKIHVVPYGVETPSPYLDIRPDEAFKIVFVGTGLKRKGLHHLLLAWQRASLPSSSKLTLICRMLDPVLEQLIAPIPRVELIRGVSGTMLSQTYSRSSLFVMPSIVEGFGQVYLEALAHGCPVLGTANSALPDLGGEADGIYLVESGKIDELSFMLERLSQLLPSNYKIREAARDCASRYTWELFRKRLIQKLNNSFSSDA